MDFINPQFNDPATGSDDDDVPLPARKVRPTQWPAATQWPAEGGGGVGCDLMDDDDDDQPIRPRTDDDDVPLRPRTVRHAATPKAGAGAGLVLRDDDDDDDDDRPIRSRTG